MRVIGADSEADRAGAITQFQTFFYIFETGTRLQLGAGGEGGEG